MKLSRKKVIAREFLILLTCAFIATIAFLGTYLYNNITQLSITDLKQEVNHLLDKRDSLSYEFLNKQLYQYRLFVNFSDEYPTTFYSNKTELWNKLKEIQNSDSLSYKWDHYWTEKTIKVFKKQGIQSGESLDKFITKHSLTEKNIQNKMKVEIINDEIDIIKNRIRIKELKLLDFEEQIKFTITSLSTILILAFPSRYLIYAIKWSLNTISKKE